MLDLICFPLIWQGFFVINITYTYIRQYFYTIFRNERIFAHQNRKLHPRNEYVPTPNGMFSVYLILHAF